jgi:hypothetical protein
MAAFGEMLASSSRARKRKRKPVRSSAPARTLQQGLGDAHWGGYDGSGAGGADNAVAASVAPTAEVAARRRRRPKRRRQYEGDSMDYSGNHSAPGSGTGIEWERGQAQAASTGSGLAGMLAAKRRARRRPVGRAL